jgi:hypothetical protein
MVTANFLCWLLLGKEFAETFTGRGITIGADQVVG